MRNPRWHNGVTVAAMVGVSSFCSRPCGCSSATRDKGSTATRRQPPCMVCNATWHRYLRGLLGCRQLGYFCKRWGQIKYVQSSNGATAVMKGDVQLALLDDQRGVPQCRRGGIRHRLSPSWPSDALKWLMIAKSHDTAALHAPYPGNFRALPRGITIGLTAPGSANAFFLQTLLDGAGVPKKPLQVGLPWRPFPALGLDVNGLRKGTQPVDCPRSAE